MAKLPTRESLGGMPSARAGGGIATISPKTPGSSVAALTGASNAQAAGMNSLGAGIAAIGKAGEAFYEKEQQQELFETERRFQEFQWRQSQDLVERQRTAPTGADGFAPTWQKDYIAPVAMTS